MRNKVPIVFVEWKKIMQPRTEVILLYCTLDDWGYCLVIIGDRSRRQPASSDPS